MFDFIRRLLGHSVADTASEAEAIVDDVMAYEEIDGWLVTTVEQMRDSGDTVSLVIDTPAGQKTWAFDKPYQWDVEENYLVEICDAHGYSRENFNNIVGDRVLIRNKHDGDDRWSLKSTPVEEFREEAADTELETELEEA